MAFFGSTTFTWSGAGGSFTGDLGQQQKEVSIRRGGGTTTELRQVMVVLKSVMPNSPVVGRSLTLGNGSVLEVAAFDEDDVCWDIHLVKPRQK